MTMSKRKMIITQDLQENHLNEIRELAAGWEVTAGRDESVWRTHLADAEIIAGWKKEWRKRASMNHPNCAGYSHGAPVSTACRFKLWKRRKCF